MGLAKVFPVRIEVTPLASWVETLSELAKGSPCAAEAGAGLRSAAQTRVQKVLTVRSNGCEPKAERGRLLGGLAVFQDNTISINSDSTTSVYALGALRLAPEASGFQPSLQRTLLASALALLATSDTCRDDGRTSVVLMGSEAHDLPSIACLTSLGAVRLSDPPAWLQAAFETTWRVPAGLARIWWFPPHGAALAAQLVLSGEARAERVERASRVVEQLQVKVDIPWLETAKELLNDLAQGNASAAWGAPQTGLLALDGGLRRAAVAAGATASER